MHASDEEAKTSRRLIDTQSASVGGDGGLQTRVLKRPIGALNQGRGAQGCRPRWPEKGSYSPAPAFQLAIGDARRRAVRGEATRLDDEVASGERENLLPVPSSCRQVPAQNPDPADAVGR